MKKTLFGMAMVVFVFVGTTGCSVINELLGGPTVGGPAPVATTDPLSATLAQVPVVTVAPATETPLPPLPVAPLATEAPVQHLTTPPDCAVLGEDPDFVGFFCLPRTESVPDYTIPVYEGGFSLVALGSGSFNGQAVAPVGPTVGHIVFLPGKLADGSTPADLNEKVVLAKYVPGFVGVTTIFVNTPYAEALSSAQKAIDNMLLNAPNCGQEACKTVYGWKWENGKLVLVGEFTTPALATPAP